MNDEPLWWATRDGDLDCAEFFTRHYSYRKREGRTDPRCIGPGEKLLLRTRHCDAMFAWRVFIDDSRDERTGERQHGVCCAIFRNESHHQSSILIRQADAIADAVWPDRRHYTYVNREAIGSKNPGYCFQRAGWRKCGLTKGGLIVLERL